MRNAVLIALCFIAGLAGSNVQPILTGAGKLLFPENSTPAAISATGGVLTIASGGANTNILLRPNGTGKVAVKQTVANYDLDVNGDVNAIGVYRSSGTPGVGSGSPVTVCTSGACISTCTLVFQNGLRTGGTCP